MGRHAYDAIAISVEIHLSSSHDYFEVLGLLFMKVWLKSGAAQCEVDDPLGKSLVMRIVH
jgi:hypothetical protein